MSDYNYGPLEHELAGGTFAELFQCGQCDGPLAENPDLADEYPFYCSECDITYDWEDLD